MTEISKSQKLEFVGNTVNPSPSTLVIIATSGTGGDIRPFTTLAMGLIERGHRVLMLVPGLQEALVKPLGIPYQVFGTHDEGAAQLNNPDLWDEKKGWGVIWKGLEPYLGTMCQLIRKLPANESCVVLSHPILIPMAALARSVRPDLRIVAAYLAPSNLCSSHDMLTAGSLRIPSWVPTAWRGRLWKLIHRVWIDPLILPTLNAARTQNHLPPIAHFFEHVLTTPDASLGLFPEWFASVQPDWPPCFLEGAFVNSTEQTQVSLPPELEQFLAAGDPPIIFTPGTGHRHAARYFNIALETLTRLNRRGLFITPHAEQLPASLPPNVMWQAHVPFAALLPRAAAIVHHGGIGTIADAFRAGTPQLIIPFAYDQFDNALRAKRMGAAAVLLAKHLSVRRMERQLADLLADPAGQQKCSSIAQNLAQISELPWLLERVEIALFDRHPVKLPDS